MKDFFYGISEETYEEKAGIWGAIASGVGMATQGITTLIASGKQGTASCGAKPTCISFSKNSDCKQRKESWLNCRDQSLALQGQSIAGSYAVEQQKIQADLEKSKRMVTIVVISAVTLAIIVIGTALLRRRKNRS